MGNRAHNAVRHRARLIGAVPTWIWRPAPGHRAVHDVGHRSPSSNGRSHVHSSDPVWNQVFAPAFTARHGSCSEPCNRTKARQIATRLKMRHEFIADAIERYLQRHPAAADSEVGIAEWWLIEQGVRASVDDVRAALKLLESRGVMETVTLQGGRCLWRPTRRSPDA